MCGQVNVGTLNGLNVHLNSDSGTCLGNTGIVKFMKIQCVVCIGSSKQNLFLKNI